MQGRVVLITNDSDFFEFIAPKLKLRKSDELFRFKFEDIPEKLHLLQTSVLMINSESSKEQTIELLRMLKGNPTIIFSFNEDENFKIACLKAGALSYFTPMTSDDEIDIGLTSALNVSSLLIKNLRYREILEKNNCITPNNEVFLDYVNVLDRELDKINKTSTPSVLAAISPNEKTKFLIKPNQIETIILNNIRKNDILMNFAVNKYFLLLFDTDIDGAQKIWAKIASQIPEKIYAGFAKTFSKSRQQLINEALNKLHEAINYEKFTESMISSENPTNNFKQFKHNFNKKIEQVITPTFYHIKQKYTDKLYGVIIEQDIGDGYGVFRIKSRQIQSVLKITSAGFSKINIDITYLSGNENLDTKRIALEPDELEAGFLEDLLEQFILEFKKEINDGTT